MSNTEEQIEKYLEILNNYNNDSTSQAVRPCGQKRRRTRTRKRVEKLDVGIVKVMEGTVSLLI